jgi:hypothetical protein
VKAILLTLFFPLVCHKPHHFGSNITPNTAIIAAHIITDKDIENAVVTLQQHNALIQKMAKKYNQNNMPVLSIVFPEIIRYNAFKDFLETKTLEWLYVEYGKDKADFSIGLFQMKPSFVEKLEKYLQATPSVFYSFSSI